MSRGPYANTAWTSEDVDRLRELVQSGATAKEIAVHYPGKTRNAILGKAFRLGLRLDHKQGSQRTYASFWSSGDNLRELAGYLESPQGYSQAEIARRFDVGEATIKRGMKKLGIERVIPLKPNAASRAQRVAPRARKPTLAEQIAAAPLAPVMPETAMLIGELTATSCRWPVEGHGTAMLYCGGQALEGHPYCAGHCRVAYQENRR